MDSFDLITADSFLPIMDNTEENTKKLINSITMYSSLLDEKSKPILINFILTTRLSDSAKMRLSKNFNSVDHLVNDMKKHLLTTKSFTAIQQQLLQCTQKEKTINEYGKEIEDLFVELTVCQADGDQNKHSVLKPINEKMAIRQFSSGLRNAKLSALMLARDFNTINDAIRGAMDEEVSLSASQKGTGPKPFHHRHDHGHMQFVQQGQFSQQASFNPNNQGQYSQTTQGQFAYSVRGHHPRGRGNFVPRGRGNYRGHSHGNNPTQTHQSQAHQDKNFDNSVVKNNLQKTTHIKNVNCDKNNDQKPSQHQGNKNKNNNNSGNKTVDKGKHYNPNQNKPNPGTSTTTSTSQVVKVQVVVSNDGTVKLDNCPKNKNFQHKPKEGQKQGGNNEKPVNQQKPKPNKPNQGSQQVHNTNKVKIVNASQTNVRKSK